MIAIGAIFALLLGIYVFAVLPQAGLFRRAISVGIFLALVAVIYGGASELLGRPKPLWLEWRSADKAQVVSAVPVENQAIYLWITVPASPEPRTYVLPWSQEAAQQLQNAMNEAEADGTQVEMAMALAGDPDHAEPVFYAKPQPPLPLKDYRGGEALTYVQPENPE
jgi:hypothetical protein